MLRNLLFLPFWLFILGCNNATVPPQPAPEVLAAQVREEMQNIGRIEYRVLFHDPGDSDDVTRWGPIVIDDPEQIAIAVSFAQEIEDCGLSACPHCIPLNPSGIDATYIDRDLKTETRVRFSPLTYILYRDFNTISITPRSSRSQEFLLQFAQTYAEGRPELIQTIRETPEPAATR